MSEERKAPNYKGYLKIPCNYGNVTVPLALWKNKKDDGSIYLSVRAGINSEITGNLVKNEPKKKEESL